MRFIKIFLITLTAGTTVWAFASTMTKSGVRTVAYPQGISLRMDSVDATHAGAFPRGRTFRGGGILSGK